MNLEQARGGYLDWIEDTRTISEHTLRAYCGDLAALRRHLAPAVPAGSISSEGLVEFIAAQRGLGLTAATIRRRSSPTELPWD
ncbi:site-specific integrase [Candidatus Poriferisocius sp.]|uniref:site-specific integrase n=1 Tax=Candidatus Poriferisocius sp. TaxID=3101276 RepID=UPI003B020FF5